MAAHVSDAAVESDIRQLQGLTLQQDSEAFGPVHAEDLSPDFARRVVGYNRLVDDAVDAKGVKDGWLDIRGLAATHRSTGTAGMFVSRECPVTAGSESITNSGPRVKILHYGSEYTGTRSARMDEIAKRIERTGSTTDWVPIYLKRRVEYEEVLDDVASQLREIARVVGGCA